MGVADAALPLDFFADFGVVWDDFELLGCGSSAVLEMLEEALLFSGVVGRGSVATPDASGWESTDIVQPLRYSR